MAVRRMWRGRRIRQFPEKGEVDSRLLQHAAYLEQLEGGVKSNAHRSSAVANAQLLR